MEILAHRGLWESKEEKNTMNAFIKAFDRGFGIETDIRDYKGKLIISHDMGTESSIILEELFDVYSHLSNKYTLALNTKADGIQDDVLKLLTDYEIDKYFFFDMSVPEMVVYWKKGLHFFTRHSDIESQCVLYEHADGVWIDSFFSENWFSGQIVNPHINYKKKIGLISAEIHGFDNRSMWNILKKEGLNQKENFFLCTDTPEKAKEFFEI